jgi:hypothetical protein
LEFSLEYPSGAAVETLTLARIAGGEAPIDLKAAGTDLSPGLSGTKTDIPVGYYMLRAVVQNSDKAAAGRTEVVHIYPNLKAQVKYTFIDDDFRAYRVTSTADSGPGSLRQALTDALAMAEAPQTVQVVLEPGSVIALENHLPDITKSLVIEGNGITLTRAASWSSNSDHLLRITAPTMEVQIRRVYFKDGLAENGGAISNNGILTLESCIFSNNRVTIAFGGGAIYTYGTLTIRGCTFYGNTAGNTGGAVCFAGSGTSTLEGNLFYGNTAASYPVVYNSGETVNASYNVVDAAFGTGSAQAGWAAGTGDTTITAFLVSGKTFRPLYGSEAIGRLPATLPADYPTVLLRGPRKRRRGRRGRTGRYGAGQRVLLARPFGK